MNIAVFVLVAAGLLVWMLLDGASASEAGGPGQESASGSTTQSGVGKEAAAHDRKTLNPTELPGGNPIPVEQDAVFQAALCRAKGRLVDEMHCP